MSDSLVRAVAATGLHGSSLGLPGQPLDAAEWSKLVQKVRFHRLAGLLAAAVHDDDLPATPEQRDEARAAHATAMQLCLKLEADLLQVGGLLDGCGVSHRVLKGPAFAHLDYPDPALRAFADIDLLVRSEHYDAAVETLTDAGFERKFTEIRAGFDHRFGKGVSFKGPNGRELDLHRTFVMGPYGLMLDLDDVWGAVDRFEIAGRSFETLDANQRFLHACYHAAVGNARTRLGPLRDVAGMLQRSDHGVDVDHALALSARWQSTAVVARAVELTWDAFALPETPLAHWARDFSPSDRDRRALRTYLDLDMGYAARSYAALQ
ncbi:MAG: nucleotidyltransferase family protein, partial [Nocardioidaceae bacterium]